MLEVVKGYCLGCRTKQEVELSDGNESVQCRNGRWMCKVQCPTCQKTIVCFRKYHIKEAAEEEDAKSEDPAVDGDQCEQQQS